MTKNSKLYKTKETIPPVTSNREKALITINKGKAILRNVIFSPLEEEEIGEETVAAINEYLQTLSNGHKEFINKLYYGHDILKKDFKEAFLRAKQDETNLGEDFSVTIIQDITDLKY